MEKHIILSECEDSKQLIEYKEIFASVLLAIAVKIDSAVNCKLNAIRNKYLFSKIKFDKNPLMEINPKVPDTDYTIHHSLITNTHTLSLYTSNCIHGILISLRFRIIDQFLMRYGFHDRIFFGVDRYDYLAFDLSEYHESMPKIFAGYRKVNIIPSKIGRLTELFQLNNRFQSILQDFLTFISILEKRIIITIYIDTCRYPGQPDIPLKAEDYEFEMNLLFWLKAYTEYLSPSVFATFIELRLIKMDEKEIECFYRKNCRSERAMTITISEEHKLSKWKNLPKSLYSIMCVF